MLHSYELSADQLNDFLSRNPFLSDVISNAIQIGYWPNECPLVWTAQGGSCGYSVVDSVYGTVLISTDAGGYLHYNAQSPIDPVVTNTPPYTSPTVLEGTCESSAFGICFDQFFGTVGMAAKLAGLVLAVWLLKKS